MTRNVRKLALDLGLAWLLPIQVLTALVVDFTYLQQPELGSAMTVGVMLSLQATTTSSKVALWRTLPATRREIGQARWWQMTGLAGVGIIAMMGAALALHALMTAMGWNHQPVRSDAMAIVRCLLLQFFYPVFLTLFWLAMTFARTTRAPFAYAALIAVWTPWLLLFPHAVADLSIETRTLALGLAGLVLAAVLYATAPDWPEPVTQPMQMDIGSSHNRATKSHRAERDGWLALCGIALLRPALMALAILTLYIGAIVALKLGRAVLLQLRLFIPLIVTLQIIQFNATALRVLRALPGSTLRLTAYLFLPALAVVAMAICLFSLILAPWLMGDAPRIDLVALSAFLIATALVLPAALPLRQAGMALVLMLSMVLVPLIEFGWNFVPPSWADKALLAGLTALVICAGFSWMYMQVSRGTRVYRLQPFVSLRWRGNG